jgi:long-chain fatty acid transport protein
MFYLEFTRCREVNLSVPYLVLLLLIIVTCSTAQAGGLYIREFGQPAQGTSGEQVLAEDASTAFANPSGLFFLDSDSEWMVTGVVVSTKAEFDPDDGTTIPGNDGGDGGDELYGGALFHTRRLSEDWGFAFSINSIAGAGVEYNDAFVGRYQGIKAELLTILFTPSVAYKVNDNLSFSFGVPLMYGSLDLDVAIPPLIGPPTAARDGIAKVKDGEDFSATIQATMLWQVTESTRIGLGYLGENELEFDSDLRITLPGAGGGTTLNNISADIEIPFAQTVSLSAATEVNDQLTLTARVGWEDWSTLDSIPLSTNQGGVAIPLNWDDVWSVGVGMRWKSQGPWTYYGGIAYDSDPTSADDRIVILPVDEQWRFSGGTTYEINESRKIGATITYIDFGDAPINSTTGVGNLSGDYKTNRGIIFGVNYSWK